jgi:erythronate-4-phosphate dehydrogenase
MLIVADENIPLLESFFGDIGDIRRVSGRTMTAADVQDADVLLVRSVTRVGPELLEGSRVRFVGTATIGTDHVDQAWLAERGIRFAAAPGCNANSVAEFVLSVLSVHAEVRALSDWTAMSVGIVGSATSVASWRASWNGLASRSSCAIRPGPKPRATRSSLSAWKKPWSVTW